MLVTLYLNEWAQGVLLCVHTGQITSWPIDSLDGWPSAEVRWGCRVRVRLYLQNVQAVAILTTLSGHNSGPQQCFCRSIAHWPNVASQSCPKWGILWYVLMWKWCLSSFVPASYFSIFSRKCQGFVWNNSGIKKTRKKSVQGTCMIIEKRCKRYLCCADILVNEVRIWYQKSRPLDKYPSPSPKSMNMQWEML